MPIEAIASDYDETLACSGRVDQSTLIALACARKANHKLLLVTGRELGSLQSVFPELNTFDLIVAENGAVLYDPSTAREKVLCPPASQSLFAELQRRRVRPLWAGRCIIGTVRNHTKVVQDTMCELGLKLHMALNRQSLMVLPAGVDKGTGLEAALRELGLVKEAVMGIGDAENDLAFLRLCGISAAVANATDDLKSQVRLVTTAACGAGVVEVINKVINNGNPF